MERAEHIAETVDVDAASDGDGGFHVYMYVLQRESRAPSRRGLAGDRHGENESRQDESEHDFWGWRSSVLMSMGH